MKSEAGGMSETLPASERQRECGTGGTDCLAERMRRAEETSGTGARPGNFALGPTSRAAARSLLNAKRAVEGEGTLIRLVAVESPRSGQEVSLPIPRWATFAICRCFYEAK